MSVRLGLSGAYNRQKILSPIQISPSPNSTDNSSSASVTKVNKELKALKEKNKQLKAELEETRLALKQIFSESSHEKFDERRVNLIKFQIIQLERQIASMTEALGYRTDAVLEAENSLACLGDKFRSYISSDVKGPVVSIPRTDLMALLDTSESARIKLFKAVEKCHKDEIGKELLLLNPFLDRGKHMNEEISVLDVSLNRFKYLNLQHVSKLESKLSTLYKELVSLHESLQMTGEERLSHGQASAVEVDRLETKLLKCCVNLRDSADDLLALSLLCPSAPWPALKRPVTKEVPVQRVVSSLPPLPQSKQTEVTSVLTQAIGTCNHRLLLLEKEKAALREELTFHRTVYEFQLQHGRQLFECVRKGYIEFEESVRSMVCEPIKALLNIFFKLRKSASERSLREFLLKLKENEPQLSAIVNMFDKDNRESMHHGAETVIAMEVDFITKLDLLVNECSKERDKILKEKKKLIEDQERQDRELQHLLEEMEAKYEKQWVPNKLGMSNGTKGDSVLECSLRDSVLTPHNKDSEFASCQEGDSLSHRTNPADSIMLMVKKENESKERQKGGSASKSSEPEDFVLRGYLDEASDWVSDFTAIEEEKGLARASKEDNDDSSSVCCTDDSQTSKQNRTRSKPGKKSKWKPDKEWVNDFNTNAHTNQCETDFSHQMEMLCENANVVTNTVSEDSSCYTAQDFSRRGTSNEKKSRSYNPNLLVAQQSLRLKKKGNSQS